MSKSIKIIMMLISIIFIFITFDRLMTLEARQYEQRLYVIRSAEVYIEHGIYQNAIPIIRYLIDTEHNIYIATERRYQLMRLYYDLGNERAYRNALQELLNIGISPQNMSLAELYIEMFYFNYQNARIEDKINFLRRASATENYSLVQLFEDYRFHYTIRHNNFDYVGSTNNNNAIVSKNGIYGIIDARGNVLLQPSFELVTNFIGGYAVVQSYDSLEIINLSGVRQSVADFTVNYLGFWNGSDFVHGIVGEEGYFLGHWPSGITFYRGYESAEFIGAVSEGLRVFGNNGLYFIFNEFIYESIATDTLGRAAVNGRVFVSYGNGYYMKDLNGNVIAGSFEVAKPFFEANGLAAVKQNGLWGLIDNNGNIVIDFINNELESSSFGLVAFLQNGLWGFMEVGEQGSRIVIEPQFLMARQFVNGAASVLTEQGFAHIILTGY